MAICKWCGKPLRKRYNSRKYHVKCEKYAREEQNRINRSKYYYKNRDTSNSLGSSNLTENYNPNPVKELEVVEAELKRYNLLK